MSEPALPFAGGGEPFVVRRIFCVGQNYADHAREMGGDGREPPFFFSKPATALVPGGGRIAYPPRTSDFHHEVELVVAIGEGGAEIAARDARAHLLGAAVGIDLTRRDLQAEAKRAGKPWDMSKGFDQSGPCGLLVPIEQAVLDRAAIRLSVNGAVRQDGDLDQMIWSVDEIVAELSTYVRLERGDLIFTGTPAGVGPLVRGDRVEASIDGLPGLTIEIV